MRDYWFGCYGYGVLNPRAQYRFNLSVDDVLADREMTFRLTRAMCAPIGDGAASAPLCSAEFFDSCDVRVKARNPNKGYRVDRRKVSGSG